MPDLTVRPLTVARWADLEALFAARGCGAARRCWCMYYRRTGRASELFGGRTCADASRAALRALARSDLPPGLIAYRARQPVGWISLGPRDDFARLKRSSVMKAVDDTPVWSIVCFVVPAEYRNQGVARGLLEGAIAYARRRAVARGVSGRPSGTQQRRGNVVRRQVDVRRRGIPRGRKTPAAPAGRAPVGCQSKAPRFTPRNSATGRAPMIPAQDALRRLREGNRRFVAEVRGRAAAVSRARREELAAGQEPFAIILGCSDSRVPAEIVFDQGLGDLFVIRVAGNIVAPSQVESVEFAAARFETRLVVVLGHTSCGAIQATVDELGRRSEEQSRNLRSIVDRIRPAVEPLLGTSLARDRDALMHQAVRANIRMSANQLRHGSNVLEQLIDRGGLCVVGAEYSLDTGEVEFFDGVEF